MKSIIFLPLLALVECSQHIQPPCVMKNTSIHFVLEMSEHVKPFMITYYNEILNQYQVAFQQLIPSRVEILT